MMNGEQTESFEKRNKTAEKLDLAALLVFFLAKTFGGVAS